MNNYEYLDPTGRRLTLSGELSHPLRLWQAQFTLSTPMNGRLPDSFHTRQFNSCHAGNHDGWLQDSIKGALVGEYSISGGVLEVWRPSDAERQGLARWVSKHHEVSTFLPFQLWEDHDFVLAYFNDVEFVDEVDGVLAIASDPTHSVSVLNLTSLVSGLGMMEFMTPAVGLGQVPSWEGAKVPAGEVWKSVSQSDPDVIDHLILATSSTVATFTPSTSASLKDGLAFLGTISNLSYENEGVK